MEIEAVHPQKSELGEGPIWDSHNNAICWVDILNGKIHELSLSNASYQDYTIGHMVGCVALCDDGNFIFASTEGIGFLDRKTEEITYLDNPEEHLPKNRFNDGKCDPMGRLWVGSMSLSEAPGAGSVYMFEKGQSKKRIDKTTISNGLAWNSDHDTFYFIDTPTKTVASYDFDKITGTISEKKIVIEIPEPEKEGFPDGMTIDAEGMLWIAHWGGWQVTRWNPKNGELLQRIKMPVAKITSCTFGGKDLKDLYVTSAKVDVTDEELKDQPLAGSLFVVKNLGCQGVEPFLYHR